jgi:hypothetical protein
MNRLDELIVKNSKGLLSDFQRWNLNSEIENSIESTAYCSACEKIYPEMPSKSLVDSSYCKGHLRYSLATGIDPYIFFK